MENTPYVPESFTPTPLQSFIMEQRNKGKPEHVITNYLVENKKMKLEEVQSAMTGIPYDPEATIVTQGPGTANPIGTGNIPTPNVAEQIVTNPKSIQKKVGAGIAEYVMPAAVTMMLPESLLLQFGPKAAPYIAAGASALVTGGGTLTARQIQGDQPIEQQFKDAGTAMLVDGALNLGLSTAGRYIAGKILKKGDVAKDVTGMHTMAQDAQDILSETTRNAGKTWYGAPKTGEWISGDPGSLTLGGMEGKSSEIAKTVEGFLRGSFIGKGKFKQADELNINAVEEIYSNFVNQVSDATNDVRFGKVLQSLTIGKPDPITGRIVKGGIAGWIDDTKDALYTAAKSTYEGKGLKVDISHIREQMKKFEGVPEFESAFATSRPYLPPDRVIPGKPAYDVHTGELSSWGHEITDRISKEPDIVEQVNHIPVEDAILLKRELNRGIKNLQEGGKWKGDREAFKGQVDRLRDSIYTTLENGAEDQGVAFKLAESFVGTANAIHEQAFAKTITKKLSANPTAVLSYMESAKNTYESLDQLERLWNFAREGMGNKVEKMALPTFEDAVVRPLRYNILNEAYDPINGAFNPKGIQNAISRYDESTRIRLFGRDYNDRLTKISNAAVYLADYKFQDRILTSLVESGLIASTAFGLTTGSGLSGKALKTLAAVSFLDSSLSNLFTRPKFANRVIEGLNFGPTDSRFLAAVYSLTSEGIADLQRMKSKNPDAARFYSAEGWQDRMNQKQVNSATPVVAPNMAEMVLPTP